MKNIITICICCISLSTTHFTQAQTYFISPVAGIGSYGYAGDGGQATNAELNGPAGIVVDDSGNIIFCDESNNRIRKIDTKGIITTIAGNGSFSYSGDGGPATSASMANPLGLALDDSGNIFIADWGNSRIRKINKKGIITTIAGTGALGFTGDGGPATAAELDYPYGVGVDSLGNVYITDSGNDRLRKVDTNGIITTIAGVGTPFLNNGDGGLAINAGINFPTWVWIDHKGNIYVANALLLRKINTNDTISTIVGNYSFGHSGDGGPATDAEIGFMEGGGAFDDSMNFYFPEFYHEYVRKVYANDTIITIAGNGTQAFAVPYGNADSAELSFPYATATDHFGNIYVTDNGNQRIRKLSPCSKVISVNAFSPTICMGDSVALKISSANTYAWSPSTGLSDTTGDSVIASPSITTTYTITGTTCTATATITVTVDSIPVVTLNQSPASICIGQDVVLIAGGAASYTWNPSSGLNTTAGDTVIASPTVTTTYTITGNTAGCSSQTTDEVILNPLPDKPHITVNSDVLTSSSTQGNQWFLNDTLIVGATNQNYTALKSGYYTVTAENPANGCSATSNSVHVTVTGIEQISANSSRLSIYPNPTSNQLTIVSYHVFIQKIEIDNVLGQIVFNTQTINTGADLGLKQTIDVSTLPDGIYFITITSGDEKVTQKVSVINNNR